MITKTFRTHLYTTEFYDDPSNAMFKQMATKFRHQRAQTFCCRSSDLYLKSTHFTETFTSELINKNG